MTKHLTTYDPFSVVVVPFPFTDLAKSKRRPAVVISSTDYQIHTGHITLLMVTSAFHNPWFGDHTIKQLAVAGLKVDFIIRQKIFTIDLRVVVRKIGELSPSDIKEVTNNLRKHITI